MRIVLGPCFGAGLCATTVLGGTVHAADAANDAATDNDGDENLQNVTVTGVRSLLRDKLGDTALNTPQSVTVVGSELISAQGATRLEDALRNVPGITLNAGEGAARGDTVNIRGFSAFNDFFIDGIRDAAVYTRDIFDADSVEVLEGPSAVLFGRGSTGGAINQVTKAPLLTPLDNLNSMIGTNDLVRTTGDFNFPFGTAAAFRLNVMGESSEAAGRAFAKNRRWGIAPAIGFGLGEQDSVIFTYLHQHENNVPDGGLPFVDGAPAPVPRSSDYGLVSDVNTTLDDIATVRYRHDFSSLLSIADTLRYAHYEFDYQSAMPNFGAAVPTATTPLTSILVGRDEPGSSGVQTNLTEQLDLTAHFNTGPLRHSLVTGIEIARQTSDLDRYLNPFNANNGWVPETSLLDPNPVAPLPQVLPVASRQDTTARSDSLYVTDTIGFNQYFDLLASARYDRFSADYHQLTVASGAVLDLSHVDNVGSPRAAFEYKPTPDQTYYIAYGTSFDPSAEALTLTTKTANLGPVKAKSYEAGAKEALLGGGLQLSAAVFRTEVDNAQTNDPDNPTLTILDGDQRVDGLELQATGHLSRNWELFAGYSLLNGETLSSGTAAYVGKELPNVAHNSLNLWTEYYLPFGIEVGGGANWLGPRFADSGETAHIPGYVVWNAMISYKVSHNVSLQLNGLNLFNRYYYTAPYYTSAAENHVIPGAGRSGTLSINVAL
ncbi:MAG TPA: TonB-dependent siderophore receptor [Steroidobacteraceae bacterium]|nr:TonB-dependent siderophore receptor [Steroidobacteraceae bacterium]